MKTRKRRRFGRRRLQLESLEGRRLLTAAPHPFDLSTLDGTNGFRIDGEAADTYSGAPVAGAGDVNADGMDDFLIGSDGAVYVVYGTSDGVQAEWNVNELDGTNGFAIRSTDPSVGRTFGDKADAAGDVNGDGFDDVIVSDSRYGDRVGIVYVIYGSADSTAVFDVADIDGANGFRIVGDTANNDFGFTIAGVGDVNGDGFDDVAADYNHNRFVGEEYRLYVVYGQAERATSTVELSDISSGLGFTVEGSGETSDRGVRGGGDLNGDGFDDMVLGHQSAVVFGAESVPSGSVEIDQLTGQTGFRVLPLQPDHDTLLWGMDTAGDVNGDGFDDVLIAYHDSLGEGYAIVIFGTGDAFPANFDSTTLDGTNGFRINGEPLYEEGARFAGSSSFAGDINADGYDDIIFGTSNSSGNSLPTSSYVLFGRPVGFPAAIDVADFDGSNGFRLDSYQRSLAVPSSPFFDKAGRSVRGAGDFNGDGYTDLLIGADLARAVLDGENVALNAGATYVIFGGEFGAFDPDVTASVADGVLRIEGTDKKDEVRITQSNVQLGVGSTLQIEGLGDTTINGQAIVSFDEITELQVETGRGADTVVFNGGTILTVNLDTGKGNDYVEIIGVPSRNRTSEIHTGPGNDHVLVRVAPGLVTSLYTGKGDDRVTYAPTANPYQGPGRVELGGGDDVLEGSPEWDQLGSEQRLVLLGGAGFDHVFEPSYFQMADIDPFGLFEESIDCPDTGPCFIGGEVTTEVADGVLLIKGKGNLDHDLQLTSTGEGQVSLASLGYGASIAGLTDFNGIDRVKVVLGSGRDSVFAENLWLSDKLIINTGLGDDNVQVVGGQLNKLRINTGGGDDDVLLDGVTVDRRAKIVTGWGVDHLTIRDSLFRRKAIFESGLDEDTLELLAGNTFNKGYNADFENVLGG